MERMHTPSGQLLREVRAGTDRQWGQRRGHLPHICKVSFLSEFKNYMANVDSLHGALL